jgi:hypothetical protein
VEIGKEKYTNMMTFTSTTPRRRGSFSTGATNPSVSSTKEHGKTLNETMEGMTNLTMDGGEVCDKLDVEDDSSSANDSNHRSIYSSEWRIGDESSVSSRRGYESRLGDMTLKETRAVTNLKLLVFGSLFFSMIAVVLSAYFFTAQGENHNFEVNFYDDANKILGSMGLNLQRIMDVSDAFITSITSYAARTNQTWPYVVIPDFYVTAEKIRSLCGAVYIGTYHVVQNDQRKEWENFTAMAGTKMVDDAIATIAEYNDMDWPISSNHTEWNVIFDYTEYDKENKVGAQHVIYYRELFVNPTNMFFLLIVQQGEEGASYDGPYLPIWQIQPTIAEMEGPYNWDLMSVLPIPGQELTAAEIVIQEHKPVITEPYLLGDTSNPEQYQQDLNDALWLSSYVPQLKLDEVMRPIFDFHFPILADAHDKIKWTDGTYSREDHKVVGLLAVSIYWSYMIRDILPEGSSGILVVFDSACTQKFTYEVNGPDVVYLGAGDYGDPKYDHMTISSLVSDLRFYSNHPSTYTGLPLEDSYCPLYISIRASAKMEAAHTTNKPWIFALVTFCVFVLTVLAFMLYNYVVERRQTIVLKSAGTYSTNHFWLRVCFKVHSLFCVLFHSYLQCHCFEPFPRGSEETTHGNPSQRSTFG